MRYIRLYGKVEGYTYKGIICGLNEDGELIAVNFRIESFDPVDMEVHFEISKREDR